MGRPNKLNSSIPDIKEGCEVKNTMYRSHVGKQDKHHLMHCKMEGEIKNEVGRVVSK